MSLALNILDLVTEKAASAGAASIERVEIEVGELAGVETEALVFCFELARLGTPAAVAELRVHTIAARGRCAECGREQPVAMPPRGCTRCGGGVRLHQGREMRLRSITVDGQEGVENHV